MILAQQIARRSVPAEGIAPASNLAAVGAM
jgi:hypothetical protein